MLTGTRHILTNPVRLDLIFYFAGIVTSLSQFGCYVLCPASRKDGNKLRHAVEEAVKGKELFFSSELDREIGVVKIIMAQLIVSSSFHSQ